MASSPSSSSRSDSAAPGASLTGARGTYVLRAQIHAGPRSDVWLAEQQQQQQGADAAAADAGAPVPPPSPPPPPSRRVAVKLVPSRRAKAAHNEADIMRKLTSCSQATGPQGFAAPLLDAFELESSSSSSSSSSCRFALVTPAYGANASAVIRGLAAERGRGLPRRAVRRMARTLLGALAHLHGPGHRLAYLDLKPHNLVVELPPAPPQDEADARGPPAPTKKQQQRKERWRLIDFGNASPLVRRGPWPLAHLPDWAPAPFGWKSARLPEYASPAYEAPESVLRIDGCPAAPADVWALGCCLYEVRRETFLI